MDTQSFGKYLMAAGFFIVVAGATLHYLPRISFLGRLPGDIVIKRDHFTFYFPLTTCIVISLALMLVSRLLRK